MPLPNRRLDDILTRHQVFVQRLSTSEAKRFDKFLREMDRGLRARISGDELTTFRRARLEKLLADVDRMLGAVHQKFAGELKTSFTEIGDHEAGFTSRAISTVADIGAALPATTTISAAVFGNPLAVRGPGGGKLLADFIDDWSQAEIKAVTGAIRTGVFQGQTNSEIVQAIRGTQAANYGDGLLEITSRNARAVVQTAVQHVSSMARIATAAANSDLVVGVQWLATLDNRTCLSCAALDLKEFPVDKGPRPPLHISCRCTFTLTLGKEFEALNKRTARPSVGPNGAQQQSAGLNYFSWLKQQPPDFQDAAIGPVRGQLLRDGGLSADRFAQLQLDKKFAPLTLAEAKLLEPLAFKEADL